jgi:hypothetical protein
MTDLEFALLEVASYLDDEGLSYMLIGGLAVAAWGEPRATLDVDVSVWVEPPDFDDTVSQIAARFRALPDALEFARRSRVVPILTSNGIRADIVLASLADERHMLARAVTKRLGEVEIRIAAVEDLVFMKLLSERAKDQEDARRLIRRFRATLDRQYLEPRLAELAEAMARTDILDLYRLEMDIR